MLVWIGLALSLASAVTISWAYTREHDADSDLPPLSARRPLESVAALVRSRAWLIGFAAETSGWIVYLVALRLAPLALVQTVGAAGIAVLALVQSRGHLERLRPREQLATLVVVAGLVLLGLSLVGTHPASHQPSLGPVVAWLAVCIAAAVAVTAAQIRVTRAVALGMGAGLLFAAGDISAKLAVHGGVWLIVVGVLIPAYALGSIELQAAFQHGDALTAAGTATLMTNAVPIAAGVVLFREDIPHGAQGIMQLVSFATLVVGATLLDDRRSERSPSVQDDAAASPTQKATMR